MNAKMSKIVRNSSLFLSSVLIGTALVQNVYVAKDVYAQSNQEPISVQPGSSSADFGGIDFNNPVLPDQSTTIYVSNEQILDSIKQNDPSLYEQIPQETINELLNEDMLRHGGTYAKIIKNGVEVYINSAITKLIVWGGAGVAGAYIVPILAVVGITGAAADAVASVVGSAILFASAKAMDLGFHASVKNEAGIWKITDWGYQ